MSAPYPLPSQPMINVVAQGTRQTIWRPCIEPATYSNSDTALGTAGAYAHQLASNLVEATATGVFVVKSLNPFNLLGLRFLAYKSSSPDGLTGTARVWLLEDGQDYCSGGAAKDREIMGEFQADLALTVGAKGILAESPWKRPSGSTFSYIVDGLVASNDRSLSPGCRITGGLGDDWATAWIDGRGARGFIVQTKKTDDIELMPLFTIL